MAVESVTTLVPAKSGESPTVVAPRVTQSGDPKPQRRRASSDDLMVRLWWLFLVAGWLLVSIFAVTMANRGPAGALLVPSPEVDAQLGWVGSVLFPESAVLSLQGALPAAQVFTLAFWFVPVVVLALLPAVLVELRVAFPVALGTTVLTVVTPLVAWGSLRPLNAILPAVVLLAGWAYGSRMKRWWVAVLIAAVAGIALARLPWSEPAIGVPVGSAMVLIALAYLASDLRRAWHMLILIPVSMATAALMWWTVAQTQGVNFSAVFPTGDTAAAASSVGLPRAFGTPFEALVVEGSTIDAAIAGELKGTWTFLVVAVAVLVVATLLGGSWAERARAVLVAVVVSAGLAWFLLDQPQASVANVPLLNLAEPSQVSAAWGIVVMMALAVLFAAPRYWVLTLAVFLGTAVLLAFTAQDIRAGLWPQFPLEQAAVVIAVSAALASLLSMKSATLRYLGLVLAILAAALIVEPMVAFQVG